MIIPTLIHTSPNTVNEANNNSNVDSKIITAFTMVKKDLICFIMYYSVLKESIIISTVVYYFLQNKYSTLLATTNSAAIEINK